MSDWTEARLGRGVQVHHGFAFKGEYFSPDGEQIVLTPGNFVERGGFKPKNGTEKYYLGPVQEKFVLKQGDVVIAMTEQAQGLLGSSATIPENGTYLHNQRIGLLEVTDPDLLDIRFVYHLMNSGDVRQQLQATATGSKVRHTAPERVQAVIAMIPPLAEQQAVASILDAIDELIENNRRRVQVLEEMARAIYREWFVNFRYPGHESVPLVDSTIGPIPEGWRVRSVGEVARVVRGRSYKSAELVDAGGLPFVNLKCMARGGGFRRDGLKRYSGQYKDDQVVRAGDLVLAVTDLTQGREILARTTLVPRLAEGVGVISLDVIRLIPADSADRLWLLASLGWSDFPDRVKEFANGSTVLHLSPNHLLEADTIWPLKPLRREFTSVIEPILEQMDDLRDQSEVLGTLRDILLPKLVTGQIDVSALNLARVPEEAVA